MKLHVNIHRAYAIVIRTTPLILFLLAMAVSTNSCGSDNVSGPDDDGTIVEDKPSFLAFFDLTGNGEPRKIRNDLEGDLPAMVQFMQSHTVNPSGNEAKHLANLTSQRAALLLVTPDTSLIKLENITVSVQLNGEAKPLDVRPPDKIFKADRPNVDTDPRPNVRYSGRAWTAVIPWEWVKPGLSLTVGDDQGREGTLASSDIEWAPPAELVINNIRLGMLADPPRSIDHAMFLRPAKAGTDYFQTAPISRLTVAKYEEVTLDSVMVADGTIYTEASGGEGGVYSGDMRENTAKSTFSVGINLANWGVTSSGMASQQQPQLTQTVVVHHAQGNYSNGLQEHGLSGGNGMLTLLSSKGNEFSHEIGHHFGLGHYPGREGNNDYWTTHNYNSGWGYIAHLERMRANINWKSQDLPDGSNGVPDFRDKYPFLKGAMSGGIGGSSSALSNYTYYTSYEVQTRIQPSLNRAMFDSESPTGYSKWNASTQQMESHRPEVPNSDKVWYNSSDGYYRVPQRQGVEVFTILGGYDPVEGMGLLYPPARSNWGNVFDLPAPEASANSRQCWLRVDYESKSTEKIALAPNRMGSNANKLHVQVAVEDKPKQVRLYCQEPNKEPKKLSQVDFPQGLDEIDPPVVIGQEAGYEAYERVK